MNYEVAGQIFKTNDYSVFKKLDGNRDATNINAILKSIDEVGYVLSPILVNENMEIVDGQHRFEALKTKKLPVFFIIEKGIGGKECIAMNTGQRNWSSIDYIHYYANNGYEDYARLMALLEDYQSDFGLDGIIGIAIEPRDGGSLTELKRGDLDMSIRRYATARKRMDFLKDMGMVDLFREKKLYKRVFWNSIGYAFRHPDVSMKELCEKMKKSPLEIVTYNKTVDQLKLFDEIYNKGRRNKKVFMATDYQLGKYKREVL